jgi:AraC-like DNA-binding protein
MKLVISKQFQAFIQEIGLSLDSVLQRAEIPNLLWKEELVLSPTDYLNFLFELDCELTDEQILAFSDIGNINTFMPPFFVALCAGNALEGFRRFAKYKKLICPLVIDVEVDEVKEEVNLYLDFDIPNSNMPRFTLLNEQLVLISLLRTGTGAPITPIRVASPHPYSEKLQQYIGVPTEMSNTNVVTFRLQDTLLPFVTQNNIMWDYLKPELKRRLEDLSSENSFLNLVEKTLFSAIPSDSFSREEVAISLGVSVRTMQRKLKSQNVTFMQLVQKVQQLLAISYLQVEELSLEEVASLVGYKEQASFSRAFKRWTGETITQFKSK